MANNLDGNKFPIYTNNIKVEIDRKKVDEKFVVYQIATKDLFLKENVLDLPAEQFKAQSVAYYQKTRWFAMFNKGNVNFDKFKQEIQAKDDSAVANEVDLFCQDETSKEGIKDVELAQLLVNSLKNRSSDIFAYNNITGKLYYSPVIKPNAKTIEFLRIRFFTALNSIFLEANTETFSEVSALKKYGKRNVEPKFLFDEETGEFRRKLHADLKKGQYFFDQGALSKKGPRKKFLDFLSRDNYRKSKAGIIATFLKDVKENLSDFITIEQIPFMNYENCEQKRINYENYDYGTFVNKNGICVVNTIPNRTDAKEMQSRIVNFLKSEYGVESVPDNREKGKYIIEIIHDKESGEYATAEEAASPNLFNEFNKPLDQHNLFSENEIIQHITVENSAEKVKSDTLKDVMHNIVQELIIKGDVVNRQITLVNWNEPKEWTFVKCGKGKWNEAKRCNSFRYYKMKICTDGKLNFDVFDNRKYPENDEWNVLDRIFGYYNKGFKNQSSGIECIVYNDINNINVIYKTKQFTLLDVEELLRTLSLSDSENKIEKNRLENYLDDFIEIHENLTDKQQSELNDLRENIHNSFDKELSYKDVLNMYDSEGKKHSLIKKKIISDFVYWLYDASSEDGNPILLHGQMKSGDNLYKNFNSFLGIKSITFDGQFKYFVGKKKEALQSNLPTSCVIRDVIPWNRNGVNKGGPIFFNELEHMLSVEFVRNGQYTVIPFPMKYLNEYVRFCEKDEDFGED